MAVIIHRPDQHVCLRDELAQLGPQPVGTVAQCSCGKTFSMTDDPRDSPYWRQDVPNFRQAR